MQTGQNSTAPESSLPQLGQVRWDSLLMFLIAFQPQPELKPTTALHRQVRNRPATSPRAHPSAATLDDVPEFEHHQAKRRSTQLAVLEAGGAKRIVYA